MCNVKLYSPALGAASKRGGPSWKEVTMAIAPKTAPSLAQDCSTFGKYQCLFVRYIKAKY